MSKFTLPISKEQTKKAEPEIDAVALKAFAAGARDKSLDVDTPPRPWDVFNPNDPPKNNVSVRLNDRHLEMLRYLSEALDTSQQRILRKHLVPVIERLAEETFANEKPK